MKEDGCGSIMWRQGVRLELMRSWMELTKGTILEENPVGGVKRLDNGVKVHIPIGQQSQKLLLERLRSEWMAQSKHTPKSNWESVQMFSNTGQTNSVSKWAKLEQRYKRLAAAEYWLKLGGKCIPYFLDFISKKNLYLLFSFHLTYDTFCWSVT